MTGHLPLFCNLYNFRPAGHCKLYKALNVPLLIFRRNRLNIRIKNRAVGFIDEFVKAKVVIKHLKRGTPAVFRIQEQWLLVLQLHLRLQQFIFRHAPFIVKIFHILEICLIEPHGLPAKLYHFISKKKIEVAPDHIVYHVVPDPAHLLFRYNVRLTRGLK